MTTTLSRWLLAGLLVIVIAAATLWLVILTYRHPLTFGALSRWPWPVACSARGCITTRTWLHHYELESLFAQKAGQGVPAPEETLTTLIRQHIVRKALVPSPVTLADATRYRTEVLHITDVATIADVTGLSLEDYDQQVILPYLQQEALRQQNKVESLDELFVQLARERLVIVLPNNIWWDKTTARVAR